MPDRMTFFPPSFSGSSRDKETDSRRSHYLHIIFFVFSVASPPLPLIAVRLSSFFSSFSNRTREGCLHAYKAVGVHALEEKTWRQRTSLERVLKTAVGQEEKEKGAKEGEGCERAKTRPDGNDPKEFRDPPFLSSFLFSLLRFATSSFLHTFSPLPSLPRTYLALSFYS